MNKISETEDSSLRQLWQLTAGKRGQLAAAAAAMIASNLCLFVPPLLGKHAIDIVSSQNSAQALPWMISVVQYSGFQSEPSLPALLWLSAVLSVLITLFAALFQYLRGRFTALASEAIAERLRLTLYQHLHMARASFFDRSQTGDLVQRCSSDVDEVRAFLASNLVDISHSLLLLICIMPVLFWIDVTLAWLSLCLMPLMLISSIVFFSRVKQLFLSVDEAEGKMTACLQENLTGIRVVHAFNRQAFEIEKFGSLNEAYRQGNYSMMKMMAYFWSLSDLVCISQMGIVLIGGATRVQSSHLSVGGLFAFITYVVMVIWPIRHLGRVIVDSGKSLVALNRINHILCQPIESEGQLPAITRVSGAIKIRNLSFGYTDNKTESSQLNNLEDINLDIVAGETLALAGAPGCGKTTLIAVLLKLYDYQQGSIKLDDNELATVDRHWLRKQFAVVFQEPFLFSRSIAKNLRVGRADSSDNELQRVCRDAALHDSILGFRDQYETLLGERGVTLSGGQRQRLALARALIKDAQILILDDALSAIDSRTEHSILNALHKRNAKQTTLIVAHRLSTFRHADRIAVMDAGRITQYGTHEELIQQPGLYQRLCAIQNQLDESINNEIEALKTTKLYPLNSCRTST